MNTQVKVVRDTTGSLVKKPTYLTDMEDKWLRWTKIDDKEAYEALKDFSGDLWGELRKLEAQLYTEIENRNLPEDFKEFVRSHVSRSWRDIIEHQKIGLDKLCIVIRKYLKE